jgi:TonB family protein
MQSNTPSAFFLSLTLHGVIVAIMLLFTYVIQKQIKETPKIFELVAGEGSNYAATEAPAESAEDLIKLKIPTVRTPTPKVTPVEPEPQPIEREVTPPPEPNPVKPVERIVETKPKPTTKKVEPKVEPPPKKMTLAEFRKQTGATKNASTAAPAPRNIKVKTINVKGIAGGSVSVSEGAGGKAVSRAESDLLDAYIALLLQRLRAAHIKPSGLSDLLSAKVRFNIAANGSLSGVKIVTSSGSREFDQSVLEAFAKVRSIGPTPNGKSDVWEVAFKMREDS